MTEWAAADYERISGLQLAMAEEVLARLDLDGASHILDVGCGNGKITAEIAERVPHATVLGVDPSHEMVEFASGHYDATGSSELAVRGGGRSRSCRTARSSTWWSHSMRCTGFRQQDEAVQSICAGMKPGACAQLRLVGKDARHSLEHVLEKTCYSARWAKYFEGVSATLSAPDTRSSTANSPSVMAFRWFNVDKRRQVVGLQNPLGV